MLGSNMLGSNPVVRTDPATVGPTYRVTFEVQSLECGDLEKDEDIRKILTGRHKHIKYKIARTAGQAKPTGFAGDEFNLAELRQTLLGVCAAMRKRRQNNCDNCVTIEYTLLKGRLTYTRKLSSSR